MPKRYRILEVSPRDAFYLYRDQLIGQCFSVGGGEVKKWPNDKWYGVSGVVGLPITLYNGMIVEAGECLFEILVEEVR